MVSVLFAEDDATNVDDPESIGLWIETIIVEMPESGVEIFKEALVLKSVMRSRAATDEGCDHTRNIRLFLPSHSLAQCMRGSRDGGGLLCRWLLAERMKREMAFGIRS